MTASTGKMSSPAPPLSYMISPQLQDAKPLALPPSEFLAQYPHLDAIMASAMVFREEPSSAPATCAPVCKTLLLRRAATDSYALKWEVPGGTIDVSADASLIAGAARELWEETSLRATHFTRIVLMAPEDKDLPESLIRSLGISPAEESARVDTDDLTVSFGESEKRWAKATFMVEVETTDTVAVRPDEHEQWAWVTEEEAMRGEFCTTRDEKTIPLEFVSDGVRRTVFEGFRLSKEMTRQSS